MIVESYRQTWKPIKLIHVASLQKFEVDTHMNHCFDISNRTDCLLFLYNIRRLNQIDVPSSDNYVEKTRRFFLLFYSFINEPHPLPIRDGKKFPILLKRLVESLLIPDHLASGFRKTGIHPANRNEILQQLPGRQKDPGGTPTITHINNSVMSLLKDQISEQQAYIPKRHGKKIVHGKPITPQDLLNNAASTSDATCKHCMQPWDVNGDDGWIQCDRRYIWYHLQCSGVDYNISDYDELYITSIEFQCDNCGSLKG